MIAYITMRPVGDTYHHARPGDGTKYDNPNRFDGGSLDINTDDAVWVG